jgi:hypothetical protein
MDPSGGAVIEQLLHAALGLIVEEGMPQEGHVKGA